jgi:lupus La protein
VRLRRHQTTKAFKGSAFVEFDTPENAKKAASETHEYNGAALTVMLKEDYFKMKKDKYAETKKEQTKKYVMIVGGADVSACRC